MTTDRELLRGLLAAPADLARRGVYADWLDEHGEDRRAAFIRWHCGLSAEPPGRRVAVRAWFRPWWAGRSRLEAVAPGVLLVAQMREDGGPPSRMYVSRGFPDSVVLHSSEFLRHARDIFELHPITRVTLSDRRPVRCVRPTPGGPWVPAGTLRPDGWVWRRHRGRAADSVPEPLWPFVTGPVLEEAEPGDGPGVWVSDTQSAALLALSDACVRFGRALAGFSPDLSGEPTSDPPHP